MSQDSFKFLVSPVTYGSQRVNAEVNEVKGEVPNITKSGTNASLYAMINKVQCRIPNITNLATTTALTAVENKIFNVINLVKKTDYNTKIREIQNKITTDHDPDRDITTQEFNKLTSQILMEDSN